ncbi:hypothetical protein STEG23_028199 [Scotinomys teguina]
MQPGRTTNTGSGTMEVVAAAPRCQLLLIMLMAAMLLPGMKGLPLLVQRTVTRTIELQESIGKDSCSVKEEDSPPRCPQQMLLLMSPWEEDLVSGQSLIAYYQQSMQGHFVAQWLTFAMVKVNSICRFFNIHIFSEVDLDGITL